MGTSMHKPELNDSDGPIWFYHKGLKFSEIEHTNGGLRLGTSAAEIFIKRHPEFEEQWELSWEVHHSNGLVTGTIALDTETLFLVFGPSNQNKTVLSHKELTERVGADFFIPGVACRWRDYVTLPNIGTGIANDSNVSILITPKIQKAVKQFVQGARTRKSTRSAQA